MKLGIMAPYTFSEQTAMALQLAATVKRLGWTTRYVSASCQSAPVDPDWDRQVRGYSALAEWTAFCDVRVWFVADLGVFRASRRHVRRGSRDILVAPLHALIAKDYSWLRYFDHIVCPDPAAAGALYELIDHAAPVAACRWPAAVQGVRREGRLSPRHVAALLFVDNYTWRRHGADSLDVAGRLLAKVRDLKLSLAFDGRPDRREIAAISRLLELHPDRFAVAARMRLDKRLLAINGHDWLICPQLRPLACLDILQARSLSVPAIAWDTAVTREAVKHRVTGMLAPCATRRNTHPDDALYGARALYTAEVALWNTISLVETAAAALSDVQFLMAAQFQCALTHTNDHGDFAECWSRLLDTQAVGV